MQPTQDMVRYYAQRATEYERIYALPERQRDLRTLCERVESTFVARRVLDVACGTGYFSAWAARRAASLDGIDTNEETLQLARTKNIPQATFVHGDVYDVGPRAARFDGTLCCLWWSEMP
jgi:demethylmenaquinone methyltransferase/2-methoxy-6-polyprenyl-1,4-benzoquinol methylase